MNTEIDIQIANGNTNYEVIGEIEWWQNMRDALQSDPSDSEFRRLINHAWPIRPQNLKLLDDIKQGGLHEGTSVGEHERRVLLGLKTDHLSNGDALWARIVALGHDYGKKGDPADPLHPRVSALTVDDHLRLLGIQEEHKELLHHLIEHHHFWGDVVLGARRVEEARTLFPDFNAVMVSHAVARTDVGSIRLLRQSGAVSLIDQAVEEAIRVNGFGQYYRNPGDGG